MKRVFLPVLLSLACHAPVWADNSAPSRSADLAGYVNILQGTDSVLDLSHGNTIPLLGVPWGMINWSIENGQGHWFFEPDGKIDGFRATHQPCPWGGDYGQFVVMPQSGDLKWTAWERMSGYDTATAILRPDYERLDIRKGAITSELTATERCAVFRFTFHQGETGRLLVNAAGGSSIEISGRIIRGISTALSGGASKNFRSYFVIELDRDIGKRSFFANDAVSAGSSADGNNVIAAVEFRTLPADPVTVRVGSSLIGWDQAERNLHAEAGGDFDTIHAQVLKTWNDCLGRVEISADEDQKKTFYSCFYRAVMFPHRLYELDEAGHARYYSPSDGKTHDGVLYADIGVWDGFRTTFPFLSLIFPSRYEEILQGYLNTASEEGKLPEWPSPGERDGMIGQHCAAIFADAMAKGMTGFDMEKAYQSLRSRAFISQDHNEVARRGDLLII